MFSDEQFFVDDSDIKDNFPVIDDFWLKYVGTERVVDEAAFAQILEDNNWFPGELQASLARLILEKKIQNLNAIRKRPKNPLHYSERGGERLRVIAS